MKIFLSLLLIFSFTANISAQQNTKLLRIKSKYDQKMKALQDKCYGKNKNYALHPEQVTLLDKNCAAEEEILDAKRSAENSAELAKIKARKAKNPVIQNKRKAAFSVQKAIPSYPTGMNGFRKEIQENFNDAVMKGNNVLRTEITFVVEPDGTISDVDSKGSNKQLNREAEIAVYLTKLRWNPAFENGNPVRYRFRLPMTFNFE